MGAGLRVAQCAAAILWPPHSGFLRPHLCKETSIAIPLTLAAIDIVESIRSSARRAANCGAKRLWLSGCVLPLAAWYGYHYAKTGFFFGNPEYLRYNAEATLAPMRIVVAFGHRILHLTAHMNLFVPVSIAFAALLLDPRPDAEGHERATLNRPTLLRILLLLLVNALVFSFLGGALLTRYLLPMYPLVLFLAIFAIYSRVPYWYGFAVLSAAAFLAALFINPPYGFAPEDNLSYARVVRMHQAGIAELNKLYPEATVLTAWPITDELTHPELGYVKKSWDVCAIDNFTSSQVDVAANEAQKYTVALVFSTKDEPPTPLFQFRRRGDGRTLLWPPSRSAAGSDRSPLGRNIGLEAGRPQHVDRA